MGGQQVMCFIKWVSLVGSCFWENRKLFLGITESSGRKHESLSVLHTGRLRIYFKPSAQTTTIFHFHCNKDNVQLSFSSTACGGKHALQLRFSAKPDSASDENPRFAPVQNMAVRVCGTNKYLQKILMRLTFQIYLKSHRTGFEPFPGSPEGRNPRSAFGYFSQRRKVTEKRPFGSFC